MDRIEEAVRGSLRDRADDVEPTPQLYRRVQRRTARRRAWRVWGAAVAGVAAVAAAVVVVPDLVTGTRTPPIADDPPETMMDEGVPDAGGFDPTLPDVALVGRADGTVDLVDVAGEDGAVTIAEVATTEDTDGSVGRVTEIVTAPGGTPTSFRAVVVRERGDTSEVLVLDAEGDGGTRAFGMMAEELGGSAVPQVAISPAGDRLAVLEATGDGARTDVKIVPIEPDGTIAVGEAEVVTTLDGADRLLSWSGDASAAGSVLVVQTVTGEVSGLSLSRREGGFAVVGTRDVEVGRDAEPGMGVVDVVPTAQLPGSPDDPTFEVRGSGEDGMIVYTSERSTYGVSTARGLGDRGIVVEPGAQLVFDARGQRALFGDGDRAFVLTVDDREPADRSDEDIAEGPSRFSVTAELDGVTAGALLGGFATAEDAGLVPDGAASPSGQDAASGDLVGIGDGIVVADERVVTLIAPDGTDQELVAFPARGESTVLDLAVRPGSTADDLTVAITTQAEGTYDVRWLRVVDGQVDTTIDPEGTDFPAPSVDAGPFPLATPVVEGGVVPSPAWAPDGSLLAVVVQPEEDAPSELRVVGWNDGPSADASLSATFPLDTAPDLALAARQWIETGEGDVLLLADPMRGASASLPLERQPDGAVGLPDGSAPEITNPGPNQSTLDLAAAGHLDVGGVDTQLLRGEDGSVTLLLEAADASSPDVQEDRRRVDVTDLAGPRDLPVLAAWGDALLVALDPAEPRLVDRTTGELHPVPIDREVIAADAIR